MTAPEERIGAAVAAWFRDLSHDTYAEVVLPGGQKRADLVALTRVPDPAVAICECKVSFGLDVLRQALEWEGWAHTLYVATGIVPRRNMQAARDVADGLGLGWLCVIGDDVYIESHPTLRQCRRTRIVRDALRPEHTTSRPGTASGEHYTATQERDARIRAHVAAHPGVELREACAALGLRLDADGRRALARHVRCALDGVTAQRDGRRLLLWPAERAF